ncbi:MAG TPA: hypothetical protein V6C63_13490 [Allocoleopsis sp.]
MQDLVGSDNVFEQIWALQSFAQFVQASELATQSDKAIAPNPQMGGAIAFTLEFLG